MITQFYYLLVNFKSKSKAMMKKRKLETRQSVKQTTELLPKNSMNVNFFGSHFYFFLNKQIINLDGNDSRSPSQDRYKRRRSRSQSRSRSGSRNRDRRRRRSHSRSRSPRSSRRRSSRDRDRNKEKEREKEREYERERRRKGLPDIKKEHLSGKYSCTNREQKNVFSCYFLGRVRRVSLLLSSSFVFEIVVFVLRDHFHADVVWNSTFLPFFFEPTETVFGF